jgi:hypothetical protein
MEITLKELIKENYYNNKIKKGYDKGLKTYWYDELNIDTEAVYVLRQYINKSKTIIKTVDVTVLYE